MSLTLADANRMIEGAMAKASELDIKISAAVVDAGGRLLAFQRMEDATWASAYGSQGKAIASVAFGQTSGALGLRASDPIMTGIAAAEGGHMIMSLGGVPIIRDGRPIGACGVGGGTGEEDEQCSQAGIACL
jgi:glc operon protein GlcG